MYGTIKVMIKRKEVAMFFEVRQNQKKLLDFMEAYPNDSSYNIIKLYEMTGKVDIELLKNSVNQCLAQAEAFKVNFLNCGEYYLQQYEEDRIMEVQIEEVSSYQAVMEYCRKRRDTPFSVYEWPLCEFKIFLCENRKVYLLIAVSHLIADAYSAYLLLDKFRKKYNQEEEKLQENKKIPATFRLEGKKQKKEAAKLFFEQELGENRNLETPEIKQRRSKEGCLIGECKSFYLTENRTEEIRQWCKEHKVTIFQFFLAIYGILVGRLTGREECIIGIPLAGRMNAKEKEILGYMVNTLPMRLELNPKLNLEALTKLAGRKMFQLMKYQKWDFEEIGTDYMGMPNQVLTYHKDKLQLQLKGCETKEIFIPSKHLMYELTTVIAEEEKRFRIDIQHGQFAKEFSFERVYDWVIEQSLSGINIGEMTLEEKKHCLAFYEKVNKYKPLTNTKTIEQWFGEIAERQKEKIAVVCGKKKMTYEELARESDQIAHWLQVTYPGIKYVAYSVEKDEKLVSLMLGIVKSGKVCVPIDLYNPPERTAYILSDLGECIFIQEEDKRTSKDRLSISKFRVFVEASKCARDWKSVITPMSGIYMIYTSGTTGKPKGVEVSHENLCSLLEATKNKFFFGENDVWTMFHSYGFDFSVWEIYGCLLTGGRLVIVSAQESKSSKDFYNLVVREHVSVLNQTPTAFWAFDQVDEKERKPLDLKTIIFGGEKLQLERLGGWCQRHSLENVKMVNMYGITETTVHVTYKEITKENIFSERESNIGKPLGNLGVYLLDEKQRLLPAGVVGEIAVYGAGVTKGYRNKSELTEQKFIQHKQTGKRLYLSGDLAYLTKILFLHLWMFFVNISVVKRIRYLYFYV